MNMRRHEVCDLPKSMAVVDALVDFCQKARARKIRKAERRSVEKTEGRKRRLISLWLRTQKLFFGCFICSGLQRVKDCPKRKKLNTLVVETNETSDDAGENDLSQVNPSQLMLNALSLKTF